MLKAIPILPVFILILTTLLNAGCSGVSEVSDDPSYPRRLLLPEQKAKIEEVKRLVS